MKSVAAAPSTEGSGNRKENPRPPAITDTKAPVTHEGRSRQLPTDTCRAVKPAYISVIIVAAFPSVDGTAGPTENQKQRLI